MINTIRNWWWARQRKMDMEILWPLCVDNSPDMDHAKAAFAVHAFNDPAWIEHYGSQLPAVIDALDAAQEQQT